MINIRCAAIFGALLISGLPLAAPASAQTLEAKLQVCSACHGANGEPINATTPVIWGQTEYMIVKQLHDYKVGDRANPIMAPMAQILTQQELRPAAAFFAGKTWPARRAAATPVAAPNGITVCQICHQPNFVGGLPAPRLAGQSYEYLIQAMNGFANGDRTNNADMVKIMQELPADQREAIARYIASL